MSCTGWGSVALKHVLFSMFTLGNNVTSLFIIAVSWDTVLWVIWRSMLCFLNRHSKRVCTARELSNVVVTLFGKFLWIWCWLWGIGALKFLVPRGCVTYFNYTQIRHLSQGTPRWYSLSTDPVAWTSVVSDSQSGYSVLGGVTDPLLDWRRRGN